MGTTPEPFPDCIDPDKYYDVTSHWGNCWWDPYYGDPGYQGYATQENVKGADLIFWFGLEDLIACTWVLPATYGMNRFHAITEIVEAT